MLFRSKPYRTAIDLILDLLRGTAELKTENAVNGAYQKDLQGKTFTLLQIFVDPKLGLVPKISANRYLLSVRFNPVNFGKNGPEHLVPANAPFTLGLCNM